MNNDAQDFNIIPDDVWERWTAKTRELYGEATGNASEDFYRVITGRNLSSRLPFVHMAILLPHIENLETLIGEMMDAMDGALAYLESGDPDLDVQEKQDTIENLKAYIKRAESLFHPKEHAYCGDPDAYNQDLEAEQERFAETDGTTL